MSKSIDERVVEMRFDNAAFQKGIDTSMKSLTELDKGLNKTNGTKAFDGLSDAVAGVSAHFTAMQVAGVTALATLVNKAVDAGIRLTHALAIDPISDGWNDYNTKLTSVQTVMNATGHSIDYVNKYFDQLDTYADKTIYNLTDMTSSLAKFTNAGVKIETAVPAIMGIANAVALAGQDAGAAQIAMYNLSQSIAGGFLTTTDYKSLNLANVATRELKQYIVDTAVAMGTLKKVGKGTYDIVAEKGKDAYKMADLFNGKLSEGWATSKVLLKTFSDFGDVTTDVGKKSLEAAQSIKSIPMMMETLKAGVGTTWTDTFEMIFGNVEEAKQNLTGVTINIQKLLDVFNNGRNDIVRGWADKGGRKALFNSVNNILDALLKVVTVIQDAWRAIFPNRGTIDVLVSLTEGFEKFTEKLIMSDNAMETFKNALRGIFAFLKLVGSIVGTVFKTIGTVLKPLLGIFSLTGDSAAKVSKSFADWAESMLLAYQNSKFLKMVAVRAQEIGEKVAEYVGKAVDWMRKAADAVKAFIAGFRDGGQSSAFTGRLEQLNEAGVQFGLWLRKQKKLLDKAMSWFIQFRTSFSNMIMKMVSGINVLKKDDSGVSFLDKVKEGFKSFIDFLPKVVDAFKSAVDFITSGFQRAKDIGTSIGTTIKSIWDAIGAVLGGVDPNVALGTLNLGLFTTGIIAFKKLMDTLGFSAIKDAINGLTGALKDFSLQLKAQAILMIAAALAVLAGALLLLAKVPADRLFDLVSALGIMGVVLIGMLKQLEAVTKAIQSGSIVATAAALILIAGALLLVALAAKMMDGVDADGLLKAGGGLLAVVGALTLMEKAKINGANMIKIAFSMGVLGGGMLILAAAIKVFSMLDLETFYNGMIRIGGALIIIGAAFRIFPEREVVKSAFAVGILAASMLLLNVALKQAAQMKPEEFAKGMLVVGGAIGIILGLLNLFKGEVATAAAFALIVASLAGMVEVLKAIGQLPISTLITAGITIAAFFAIIIGAAALVQGPIMAGLIVLTAAILALGVAVLAVGAGIFLFIKAFQMLIEIGQLGPAAITKALLTVISMIPLFVAAIVGFLVQLLEQIAANIDSILKVIVSILISVMNSLQPVIEKAIDLVFDILEAFFIRLWAYLEKMAPLWAESATKMIAGFIQGIADNIGLVVDAAYDLMINFIDGLTRKIPELTHAVANLIVAFLDQLTIELPRIIEAGTNLIVAFIQGIGAASLKIVTAAGDTLVTFLEGIEAWIRDNSKRINDAGMGIADAIVDGMTGGLTDGISKITGAAQNLVNNLTSGVKKLLGIASPSKVFKEIGKFVSQGFAEGLKSGNKQYVQDAWTDMRETLKKFVSDSNAEIKKHQDKLKELQKDRKKNAKAIKEEEKAIKQLRAERDKASATYKMMGKYLVDERDKLKKLADQYTKVSEKLEAAREALADAKQERLDYQNSTKDSFDDYLAVDAETKLSDFMTAMHEQLDDLQTLRNDLETVRAMGLNDKLYKQLVEGGVDSIPFLDQIINGGQDAIDELNQMSKDLDTISQGLGDDASSSLYDAGVHMAEGLVAGLEKEQENLQKTMDKLAQYMVDAINKKLGIKSPSRVLAETGKYTAEGLIKGLKDSSDMVAAASESVASEAVSAFEKTLGELQNKLPEEMSLSPVITPVLDLSKVGSEAAKLDSMLFNKTLTVDTSAAQAAVVAAAVKANQEATSTDNDPDMVSGITFIQNNNSPESLSNAEIYRQTNNQLSRAKGALTP